LTEITGLIATGVLIGIAILALKTGIGCGFASLNRREVLYLASSYFLLSIVMALLVGIIPSDLTEGILAAGVTMHLIIAIGLILFGIHTKKEWLSCGSDHSRKTFLILSLPCPVCVTATFLSCVILSNSLDVSNFRIGLGLGTIFFIGVTLSSFSISTLATRFGVKSPSALGTAMIIFGLFYLISPIIIPAYIQAQSFPSVEIPFNLKETATSFFIIAFLILSGFFSHRFNRSTVKGGQ